MLYEKVFWVMIDSFGCTQTFIRLHSNVHLIALKGTFVSTQTTLINYFLNAQYLHIVR